MKPEDKKTEMAAPESQSRNGDGIDRALIRDLAELLKATDLTEIEIEQAGLRVRVSRQHGAAIAYAHQVAAPRPAEPVAVPGPVDLSKHPGAVTSPMVGTAFCSPKPGDPPFVTVGATVKEGQTLLIIEAMKTMNPLVAPCAGKITQILVSDAHPVEYGQVLMIIE